MSWGLPLPATSAPPHASDRPAAHAWEADIFLAQLPRCDATIPRLTYGPLNRVKALPTRALVAFPMGLALHYGIKLPGPNVRLAKHYRRLRAVSPAVPGIPPLHPGYPITTRTVKRPGAVTYLIAVDYRSIEPSTFDPRAHRAAHPVDVLPGDVPGTSLRTDATGWSRSDIVYTPGRHPRYTAWYWRSLQGAVECVSMGVWLDEGIALVDWSSGWAESWDDAVRFDVAWLDSWAETLGPATPDVLAEIAKTDIRPRLAEGSTPRLGSHP